MNITYLQNIVAEVALLDPSQDREAEQLKRKTIDAFRVLFPTDGKLLRSVEDLNFSPSKLTFGNNDGDKFVDSKSRLKAVIEAKIEVLKHLPMDKAKEELKKINQHQDVIIKQLERTIDQYRTELREADDNVSKARIKLREQATNIDELKTVVKGKSRNRHFSTIAFWSLAVAIVGGAFTAGFYAGNVKYDTEKIDLSEQNRVLNDSIHTYHGVADYMRNKASSAHQLLGHMPYDELKLDSIQWRKVQTHIESVGFVLDTMAHYRPDIR